MRSAHDNPRTPPYAPLRSESEAPAPSQGLDEPRSPHLPPTPTTYLFYPCGWESRQHIRHCGLNRRVPPFPLCVLILAFCPPSHASQTLVPDSSCLTCPKHENTTTQTLGLSSLLSTSRTSFSSFNSRASIQRQYHREPFSHVVRHFSRCSRS